MNEDLRSKVRKLRKREGLADSLSSAGNAAILGSIPLGFLPSRGAQGAAGGLAVGGALSALGGMGLSSYNKRQRKKLRDQIRFSQMSKQAMTLMRPPMSSPEFDDSHMLMKSLKSIENMARELQEEVACGCSMPSWVEYKIYKSKDSLLSAIGYTYSKGNMNAKKVIMRKFI